MRRRRRRKNRRSSPHARPRGREWPPHPAQRPRRRPCRADRGPSGCHVRVAPVCAVCAVCARLRSFARLCSRPRVALFIVSPARHSNKPFHAFAHCRRLICDLVPVSAFCPFYIRFLQVCWLLLRALRAHRGLLYPRRRRCHSVPTTPYGLVVVSTSAIRSTTSSSSVIFLRSGRLACIVLLFLFFLLLLVVIVFGGGGGGGPGVSLPRWFSGGSRGGAAKVHPRTARQPPRQSVASRKGRAVRDSVLRRQSACNRGQARNAWGASRAHICFRETLTGTGVGHWH